MAHPPTRNHVSARFAHSHTADVLAALGVDCLLVEMMTHCVGSVFPRGLPYHLALPAGVGAHGLAVRKVMPHAVLHSGREQHEHKLAQSGCWVGTIQDWYHDRHRPGGRSPIHTSVRSVQGCRGRMFLPKRMPMRQELSNKQDVRCMMPRPRHEPSLWPENWIIAERQLAQLRHAKEEVH